MVLVIIYCVLPFGWAGSPGHYGTFALAVEAVTQAHAPAEPRINGPDPFWVKTHVDDAGEAEADLGYRVYLGGRTYEENTQMLFG